MPKRPFRIQEEEPLFDLVSYGRGVPRASGGRLLSAEVEQVRRTIQRAPEVMVKVLPRGSGDLKAVARHLEYIGRKGALDLETDDGERLGKGASAALVASWDLDLDEVTRASAAAITERSPKLVHKLMFSMPPGTPPAKVREAVRNLAREQFAHQHRYAFVLHTDEPHPHVHLVMKAVSEQGVRLHIKKATLRHWRAEFAHHLRLLGVEANATERAVRGVSKSAHKDGIYRAGLRGESTYLRAQAEAVARELLRGDIRVDPGKRLLIETRNHVVRGWSQVASLLEHGGQRGLAEDVRRFVADMSPPRAGRELVAAELARNIHVRRELARGRPR